MKKECIWLDIRAHITHQSTHAHIYILAPPLLHSNHCLWRKCSWNQNRPVSVCFQPGSHNGEQTEAQNRVLRPPAASEHLSHAEKEQSEEEKKKKSKDNSADSRRRDTAEQNGLIKLTQWRALKWSAGERRNSANNKTRGGVRRGKGVGGDNGQGKLWCEWKINPLINQ